MSAHRTRSDPSHEVSVSSARSVRPSRAFTWLGRAQPAAGEPLPPFSAAAEGAACPLRGRAQMASDGHDGNDLLAHGRGALCIRHASKAQAACLTPTPRPSERASAQLTSRPGPNRQVTPEGTQPLQPIVQTAHELPGFRRKVLLGKGVASASGQTVYSAGPMGMRGEGNGRRALQTGTALLGLCRGRQPMREPKTLQTSPNLPLTTSSIRRVLRSMSRPAVSPPSGCRWGRTGFAAEEETPISVANRQAAG